jgi:hypothetical protein
VRVVREQVGVDPLGDNRVVSHDAGDRDHQDAGREQQADRLAAVRRYRAPRAASPCATIRARQVLSSSVRRIGVDADTESLTGPDNQAGRQ